MNGMTRPNVLAKYLLSLTFEWFCVLGGIMKFAKKSSTREDGRKQLVLVVRPELIHRLKVAAMEQDKNTYEVAEEAFEAYLASGRTGETK